MCVVGLDKHFAVDTNTSAISNDVILSSVSRGELNKTGNVRVKLVGASVEFVE